MLLCGSDFLYQENLISSVKMKVQLAGKNLRIEVKPNMVKFPLLDPLALKIKSRHSIKQFILGEISSLTSEHFGEQPVILLPHLTDATLLSVSKTLPQGFGFSSWSDFQKHWELVHGYRMRQEGSGPSVYYTICLRNGKTLTYPEWTVRLVKPQTTTEANPRPALQQFCQDLLTCNPTLFGQSLQDLGEVSMLVAVSESQV